MKKAMLNINSLRGKKSLYRIAKDADIDYKTLHNHAKGNSSSIRLDHIARLCETLECSPAQLITITEPKPKKRR